MKPTPLVLIIFVGCASPVDPSWNGKYAPDTSERDRELNAIYADIAAWEYVYQKAVLPTCEDRLLAIPVTYLTSEEMQERYQGVVGRCFGHSVVVVNTASIAVLLHEYLHALAWCQGEVSDNWHDNKTVWSCPDSVEWEAQRVVGIDDHRFSYGCGER